MTGCSRQDYGYSCCIAVTVFSCVLTFAQVGTDTNTVEPSTHMSSKMLSNTSTNALTEAFTKALGFLGGRVDIFNDNGIIKMSRRNETAWKVELHGYKELPSTDLLVFVSDSGTVTAELKNGGNAEKWMQSMPRRSMSVGNSLRPEVAVRKAVTSLKWHPSQVNLLEQRGSLTFHRTEYGFWFMRLSGYSGTPIQGIGIIIEDDGSTKHKIAF